MDHFPTNWGRPVSVGVWAELKLIIDRETTHLIHMQHIQFIRDQRTILSMMLSSELSRSIHLLAFACQYLLSDSQL